MREPIEEVIRQRVRGLLAARPDVSKTEFGEAVGRGYAWVHAFLAGIRHANEIHLLVKIARYFGVTVGYLLNEADRERDAGAVTLLATWEQLAPADQDVVLQLALSLRRRVGEPVALAHSAPAPAPRTAELHTREAGPKPRGRERR